MLTSEMIKQAALAAGADKCGIAPMSRFDGAPDEMNPQKLFPEANVIFATSTSVQTEKMDKDLIRYNREIEAYNRAAIAVVEKYGFGVNDLYATSLTLPEEAHSDPVHYYTPMGTEVFANQVLAVITKALGIDEPIIYKEELYTDEPVGM